MEQAPFRTTFTWVVLLFATLAHASGAAQSRSDSTAIGRLIAAQALKDAKREGRDIRTLVFALKSHQSQFMPSPAGFHLLELAADSNLTLQDGRPVCPWFVGGQLEPKFEIVLRNLKIGSEEATVDVLLRCAGGVMREGGFGWGLTYTFRRSGQTWIISNVADRFVS